VGTGAARTGRGAVSRRDPARGLERL